MKNPGRRNTWLALPYLVFYLVLLYFVSAAFWDVFVDFDATLSITSRRLFWVALFVLGYAAVFSVRSFPGALRMSLDSLASTAGEV